MTTRHARIAVLVAATVVMAACGSATGGGGSSPSASATGPLWGPPGTGALPAAAQESLQATLDRWVDIGKLTGATAAVVTPAGVWAGAAGVDGAGVALEPDSALAIASVTKTFTAAEVLLLASRGKVDLDAPLTSYVSTPFDQKGATVRQVLAMRAGFPDSPEIPGPLSRVWTPAEVVALVPADAPRLGTVGGPPRYNNLDYVLLTQLVEKVTGTSMADVLRADLLAPAGLERTWVQTAETPAAPLTVGTNPEGAEMVEPAGPFLPSRSVSSSNSGAGCMASDAADVARWGYQLYGGRVLGSAWVKQMEADPQEEPDRGPYALGAMVMKDSDGTLMVGHGGGGSESPYTAMMEVWAGSSPVAIAVLTPQPADFGTQIYDLVMDLHAGVAVLPTGTPSTS